MTKYVYLIQSLENGYYKIGVSKSPNSRIKQLNSGNPSPTKLVLVFESEYAFKVETGLKNRYSYLKRTGEWFELSLSDELNFINECKFIENNLKFLSENNNPFI